MSDSNLRGAADEPVVRLRDEALDWLPVDDEVVALDGERDLYLGTNSSGSILWKALAAGATLSRLVELFVEGFDIEQDLAESDVDAFMAKAEAAGARILKQAAKTFWGGYSGYFADADGHVWEIAFNPFWRLEEDGRVDLQE